MMRTARCGCGQLGIDCEGEPNKVSLCHCLECQRRTGGPFGVAVFYDTASTTITGQSTTYRRDADSGFPITFHFCATCGSTVFWYPSRKPEVVAVAIGAFADPAFPSPSQEVYEQHRHAWVGALPPIAPAEAEWDRRLADLWAGLDGRDGEAFVRDIDALAAERPQSDGVSLFERACARDSTGHPDLAVPLYREALAAGLTGERRRRAMIQMASSLRALGDAETAVTILREEQARTSDPLDGAVAAFLALALADVGGEREALRLALSALAPELTRYQRSLANYAKGL